MLNWTKYAEQQITYIGQNIVKLYPLIMVLALLVAVEMVDWWE